MRCWYCDKKLGFFNSLKRELFCSSEHEELYKREQQDLLMERVLGEPSEMPSVMGGPAEPARFETHVDTEAQWRALRSQRAVPGDSASALAETVTVEARPREVPKLPEDELVDFIPVGIMVRSLDWDVVNDADVEVEPPSILPNIPRVWLAPLADTPQVERPPVVEQPVIDFPSLDEEPVSLHCEPFGALSTDTAPPATRPPAAIPPASLSMWRRGSYWDPAPADPTPGVALEQPIRRRTLISALVRPDGPSTFYGIARPLTVDSPALDQAWELRSGTDASGAIDLAGARANPLIAVLPLPASGGTNRPGIQRQAQPTALVEVWNSLADVVLPEVPLSGAIAHQGLGRAALQFGRGFQRNPDGLLRLPSGAIIPEDVVVARLAVQDGSGLCTQPVGPAIGAAPLAIRSQLPSRRALPTTVEASAPPARSRWIETETKDSPAPPLQLRDLPGILHRQSPNHRAPRPGSIAAAGIRGRSNIAPFGWAFPYARHAAPSVAVSEVSFSSTPRTLSSRGGRTAALRKLLSPPLESLWRIELDSAAAVVTAPPATQVDVSLPAASVRIATGFPRTGALPCPQPGIVCAGDWEPYVEDILGSAGAVTPQLRLRRHGKLADLAVPAGSPWPTSPVPIVPGSVVCNMARQTALPPAQAFRFGAFPVAFPVSLLQRNTSSFNIFLSKVEPKVEQLYGSLEQVERRGRVRAKPSSLLVLPEFRRERPSVSAGVYSFAAGPQPAELPEAFNGVAALEASSAGLFEPARAAVDRFAAVALPSVNPPRLDTELCAGVAMGPSWVHRDTGAPATSRGGPIKSRPSALLVIAAGSPPLLLNAKPITGTRAAETPSAERKGDLGPVSTASVIALFRATGASGGFRVPSGTTHIERPFLSLYGHAPALWPERDAPPPRMEAQDHSPIPAVSFGKLPDRLPDVRPDVAATPAASREIEPRNLEILHVSNAYSDRVSQPVWRLEGTDLTLIIPLAVYQNGRCHMAAGQLVARHPSADAPAVFSHVARPLPRRRNLMFRAPKMAGDAPLNALVAALQSTL
jgi:hypothetical protein